MLVHPGSGRRKACAACVKMKRRCDLRLMGCTRCVTKGISCHYASHTQGYSPSNPDVHTNASPTIDAISITDHVDVAPLTAPPTPDDIANLSGQELWSLSSPYDSFQFAELSPSLSEGQVRYCITEFKSYTTRFVLQNQLPFLHRKSHTSHPPIYLDLLSTSALYTQKTPENQAAIFRLLDTQVASLLAASTSSCWTSSDYLLGLQALIIYQIIRLFDGDIRQRANAERDFDTLVSWTSQLQHSYGLPPADFDSWDPYRQWVFSESVRRTVLMSVFLQCVYYFLRDGVCSLIPLLASLPMSGNGARWKMDETEWWESEALEESSRDEVCTYREFVNTWNGGVKRNLEAYERLLLVACRHAVGTSVIMIL